MTESFEDNYVLAAKERIKELRATAPDAVEADLVVRAIAEAVVEFRIGIKESP